MESEGLVENAHLVGDYLMDELKELRQRTRHITELRGRGLMVGVVLDVTNSTASRDAPAPTCCASCRPSA